MNIETPPNWTRNDMIPASTANSVRPPLDSSAKRFAQPLVAWEGKNWGFGSLFPVFLTPGIMANTVKSGLSRLTRARFRGPSEFFGIQAKRIGLPNSTAHGKFR